eukprot:CAMPEP_0183747906 /NCGR_PEP_ID=MMETSP0737-20130205/67499_1 /TAXON_ID=385413 /ORGANISM="Thalassiosira miniscula, Strain CCMP1093" /LENGTH=205 /DNA_ID=CAMNT_0025983623 /DNA_START=251 /DNA_END=868 /DNA_ORIENTATION=-
MCLRTKEALGNIAGFLILGKDAIGAEFHHFGGTHFEHVLKHIAIPRANAPIGAIPPRIIARHPLVLLPPRSAQFAAIDAARKSQHSLFFPRHEFRRRHVEHAGVDVELGRRVEDAGVDVEVESGGDCGVEFVPLALFEGEEGFGFFFVLEADYFSVDHVGNMIFQMNRRRDSTARGRNECVRGVSADGRNDDGDGNGFHDEEKEE